MTTLTEVELLAESISEQQAILANQIIEAQQGLTANAAAIAAELSRVGAEEQADTATAQAVIATDKAVLTAADRVQTGLDVIATNSARDAALIQAGVYTTEALGRAAVADGVSFKVQGSGDIAAYEYRRTNAGASVLIATYPSSAAVAKKINGTLGKNLFNKSTITAGFYMSSGGVATALAEHSYSAFIPVSASTQYFGSAVGSGTANPIRMHCFYDSSKNVLAGGSNSATTNFTTPALTAYVIVTLSGAYEDLLQLEVGAAATTYEAHDYFLTSSVIKDGAVVEAALGTGAVTPLKTNFFSIGKNLFDKSTITPEFYLSSAGAVVAAAGHSYSDFIAVSASTQYFGSATGSGTANPIRMHCFYDEDKNVLAGGTNVETTNFTTTASTAYVRVTLSGTYEDLFQLEAGSAATSYAAYGYKLQLSSGIPILATPDTSVSDSLWSGKTWATLGDSITFSNSWQSDVATMFGLTHTNFGVSGTKLSGANGSTTAICQDARINAIATTFDLITVLAGTNDWAQSVAMGATSSTDPLTFNGALNTLLTKLSTRFPTKRVVMMTTTYGEYSGGVGAGWPNSTVNNVGLTSLDYAEAVRETCKRWGTPCIDLSACGWNSANIATYVADGLHPNTAGYRRMSEVIIGGLKAITPLV